MERELIYWEENMKKKLAVLLVTGILGVTLAACGSGKEQKKNLETAGNESKSED